MIASAVTGFTESPNVTESLKVVSVVEDSSLPTMLARPHQHRCSTSQARPGLAEMGGISIVYSSETF